MPKSLDTKIQRILSDPSCKDFILADAKDADMAYGIAAPGAARSTMPRRADSARWKNIAN